MAKKSVIARATHKPKFRVRDYTRCRIYGRPHSAYRDFRVYRVCLRKTGSEGLIPGLEKVN